MTDDKVEPSAKGSRKRGHVPKWFRNMYPETASAVWDVMIKRRAHTGA